MATPPSANRRNQFDYYDDDDVVDNYYSYALDYVYPTKKTYQASHHPKFAAKDQLEKLRDLKRLYQQHTVGKKRNLY